MHTHKQGLPHIHIDVHSIGGGDNIAMIVIVEAPSLVCYESSAIAHHQR